MNDNEDAIEPTVFIVIGRVWNEGEESEGDSMEIHALLTAPDDDSAVRKTLEALAAQGYAEAELDQIGVMDGEPDDAIYEGAYQDALSGNVAIITFNDDE